MIRYTLFSLSLFLFFFLIFYTASNNIGTSFPSVFSCQELESHSYIVSSSLHRCSFGLYSFFPFFLFLFVFLFFFLFFFYNIFRPYFAFSYPLLYTFIFCYSLHFCLMSIRSSFIPQNKPVSITLSQPSWFTHDLLSYTWFILFYALYSFFSHTYSSPPVLCGYFTFEISNFLS